MLDRIIFGDNQFFGINHMSEEKAQALAEKFWDLRAITDVIDIAYECGIRAFMLNTNERAKEICDYLRNNASRYPEIRLYPSMPYAHKYADAVAEKGIFGAIKSTLLEDNTAAGAISMIARGGSTLFDKDILKVMRLLVDMEMKTFRDLDVRVVFLQNIVTDLLLGFRIKEVFVGFCDHIRRKYNVEPGFVTMNLPMLVDFLLECGIENPVVCSAINKAGYFMNPDMEAYESAIKNKPFRPIAMSILASGAVKPDEAVRYICGQPAIQSIVFGASSRNHIAETKALIEKHTHAN